MVELKWWRLTLAIARHLVFRCTRCHSTSHATSRNTLQLNNTHVVHLSVTSRVLHCGVSI